MSRLTGAAPAHYNMPHTGKSCTVYKGSTHTDSIDCTITIKSCAITGNVVLAPFSMEESDAQGGGWTPEGGMFTRQDMTFTHASSDLNVCSSIQMIDLQPKPEVLLQVLEACLLIPPLWVLPIPQDQIVTASATVEPQ